MPGYMNCDRAFALFQGKLRKSNGQPLPADSCVATCEDLAGLQNGSVIGSIEGYTRTGAGTQASPFIYTKDAPAKTLSFDSVVETNPALTNAVSQSWATGSGADDVTISISYTGMAVGDVVAVSFPYGPPGSVYTEAVQTLPTTSGTFSFDLQNYLTYQFGSTLTLGTHTWSITVGGVTATRQISIVA